MTRAAALSGTVLLALLAAAPRSASAHRGAPPPSLASDPGTPGSSIDPDGWHLLFGQAFCDTVPAGAAAARIASEAALQSGHWEFEPTEGATHLRTEWKPIHHVLFRLFSGNAFGRVYIDVTRLTDARSAIRFQGVLATSHDLHYPARGWAEKAYASAARQWQGEVRDDIAHGIPAGNP